MPRKISTKKPPPIRLSPEEARAYLVGQHGLRRILYPSGAAGIQALLGGLRCIQLDPLDPLGTNADLVALARVDGIDRGDIYRHIYPGHAFEHFAKERCLLPAAAFPYYRERAAETPWWRLGERLRRLPPGVIEAVLAEITAHGPLTAAELTDHGGVEPLDWSGWKGTARAASMALEVLWTRCQIVVCGRERGGKRYDIPARALPHMAQAPAGDFARWALIERVEAAGLLSRSGGALWSMLSEVRTSPLPDELVAEGVLEEVEIGDSPRRYLAPAGFRQRVFPPSDGRMRILGPLDPLLWDRDLVRQVFGFDYVWEVYKPAEARRWGWYVCPLLHHDRLIGRFDGAIEGQGKVLRIHNLWSEEGETLDRATLGEAMERHARACGATRVTLPRRVRRG
jgi:uncharacterized protein YcaQ